MDIFMVKISPSFFTHLVLFLPSGKCHLGWNRACPNIEEENTRFYLILIFQRLQKGKQKTVT